VHIKPDMAEARRGFRHALSLPVDCVRFSICGVGIIYQIDR
jgi:hypothetical protein